MILQKQRLHERNNAQALHVAESNHLRLDHEFHPKDKVRAKSNQCHQQGNNVTQSLLLQPIKAKHWCFIPELETRYSRKHHQTQSHMCCRLHLLIHKRGCRRARLLVFSCVNITLKKTLVFSLLICFNNIMNQSSVVTSDSN